MNTKLPQLGVLLVAAAFLGYWAVLVYCDVWRPVPLGLLLSFGNERVAIVDAAVGGPAHQAGLRAGDRVVDLGGHPIRNRLDWMTVESNLEFGRTLPLSVERGGARLAIPLPTPALASWHAWRSQYGPALLIVRAVQLVTLLLALWVAFKRLRDPAAVIGSMFLATIGVFSIALPYRFASVWRALPFPADLLLWIPFMSSVAIAAWACAFFWVFPVMRFRSRLGWCLAWAPIVPGLVGQAVFGYHTVVRGGPAPPLLPWTQSLVTVSVAYIAVGLGALIRNYRRLRDANERRRVRVLLTGSLIGAAAGTPVVLAYWRTDAPNQSFLAAPFATLGTFLFLILPLSFAYAIVRHRLFDVRVMIRQGLQYALARRALTAFVPGLLVLLGADLVAQGDEPVVGVLQSRAWLYLSLAALAAAALGQRQRWLDALDRRFFRERYNAQRLLRGVAEDVRQSASLELVAPAIVSRIEQALHPRFVALLIRDSTGRRYDTLAASPAHAAPTLLDADNKILSLAQLLGKPLDVGKSDTAWLAQKMPVADTRTIQAAAIDLVVPVRSAAGDPSSALFVLGPKRSEEPYSEDDGELLMAIAESVAMRLPLGRPVAPSDSAQFEECPACGGCYVSGASRCPTDGTALVHVVAPRVLAGRYRLERRLGQGGMGAVYKATDTSLDRPVAAKLVREDLVGVPDAVERFQREARVAAAFAHPNVVTVHDFGVAGGHAFLVMELLEGPTLRDVLNAEGRLDSRRALAILRDIGAAVEAAHDRQLIHRDLKPENICLVPFGAAERAKVLDFGIAKVFSLSNGEQHDAYTTGGALLGTPWYMAPEQLRGERPHPSWDLWALSVMAFEMLTGAHPFESATYLHGPWTGAADVDSRLAHLPLDCQRVFARALALDRAMRPVSPAVFLGELDRSLGV